VSNEAVDAPEPADEPSMLPLVLIAGADDLVCVDDACLPADAHPDEPAGSTR
jgi:hypothetical protein